MLDNLEYKQLIEDIKEISKMSNKDNSILFDFSKREDEIRSTISIYDHNGSKEELKTVRFNVENKFQSFIIPILDTFISNNDISLNDFVDVNGDNYVTYRLITYRNDQLTIDGLTFDDGFFIKSHVEEKNINSCENGKSLVLNKKGITSTYILIAIISILSIMIALLVYFE